MTGSIRRLVHTSRRLRREELCSGLEFFGVWTSQQSVPYRTNDPRSRAPGFIHFPGSDADRHRVLGDPRLVSAIAKALPVGLIVGSVEITGCERDDEGDCYAYSLERPERLQAFLKPVNQPQPKFWIPRFE